MRSETFLILLILVSITSKLLLSSRFHGKVEIPILHFVEQQIHETSPTLGLKEAGVLTAIMVTKNEPYIETIDHHEPNSEVVTTSQFKKDDDDTTQKTKQQRPNFSGLEVRHKAHQESLVSVSSTSLREGKEHSAVNSVWLEVGPIKRVGNNPQDDLARGHIKTTKLGDRGDKHKKKKKKKSKSANATHPVSGLDLEIDEKSNLGQEIDERSGLGLVIYFDWPHPSSKFALLNYRSLESFLHVYPAASFRCLLFAPTYALNYKFADALSVQQFQKYQKRGYDVQFELFHSQSDKKLWPRKSDSVLLANENSSSTSGFPGLSYFNRWSSHYIEAGLPFILFKTTKKSVLSFEVRSFALLARLWNTGGVISDFSLLLRKSLPHRGFSLRPLEGSVSDSRHLLSWNVFGGQSKTRSDKDTSEMSPVAEQGVLFGYFHPHDPVLRCVLDLYDSELGVLCGRDCLDSRMRLCAGLHSEENILFDLVSWSPQVNQVGRKPLQWLGTHATDGRWRLSPKVDARYHQLNRWPETIQQCSPKLLQLASSSCAPFKPLTEVKERHLHMEEVWGEADAPLKEKAEDIEAAEYRCSPSLIIPGAMKAASTFLFNVITSHPQVLRPLEGAGFKEAGAYSLKNNRGFVGELGRSKVHRFAFIDSNHTQFTVEKSPSADGARGEPFLSADGSVIYMFESALTPGKILHDNPNPYLVFALREPIARTWSDFRYLAHNYLPHRISFAKATFKPPIHCSKFPCCFLSTSDGKAAVDLNGSECLGGKVLSRSLQLAMEAGPLGDIAMRGRTTSYPSDLFYHRRCGAGIDPNEIVKKSLYFYMIRHWRAVFGGSSRIHVVDSFELLQPDTSRGQFQTLLKFLNLCPYMFEEKLLAKHSNVDKRVGGEKLSAKLQIDIGSREFLGQFFEPFDEALFTMLGVRFSWQEQRAEALTEAKRQIRQLKADVPNIPK